MSVQGNTVTVGQGDGYDNLEGLVISETHRLEPAQLDGTIQQWRNEFPISVPDQSGFSRSEVGELVGIQLRDHDLNFRQIGNQAGEGHAKHEVQGGWVGNIPDTVLRNTDIGAIGNAGQNDTVITRAFTTEKTPLYSTVSGSPMANDDTSLAGAGGMSDSGSGRIGDFLDLKDIGNGLGPLFFPEGPDWWHEFQLLSYNCDATGIDVKLQYQLLFDIWERDEVIELVDI